MSTLLEKKIKVNRIVAISSDNARAIEDPVRVKILKILYLKQLNAEQILDELKKSGYNKALTTLRHHLDILKMAGLIEIVKIQETRGAVTKYYGTSTKLLEYDTPKDFDSKYSKEIDATSGKIEKIVKSISQKTIKTKNTKSTEQENYNQYLLMEIVNRAMTKVLENFKHNTKF
jgi:DNA-binding transcriptional ArsR family regulator